MTSRRPGPLRAGDLRDALLGLVPTALALLVAAALVDGFDLAPWWTAVVLAVVTAAVDALARPVLRLVAGRAGAVAAMVLGVLVQLAVLWIAVNIVPGVTLTGIGAAVLTLIVVAVVLAAVRWLIGVNDSSYLVADLIRRGEKRARSGVPGGGPAGVVIVQIDGLPFPVLRFGVVSGDLPTLARWVRTGRHDVARWWARVPSTTPASQAALLHGTNDGISAFRWYDKKLGRLVVANRPADAAEIEKRLSNGRGLLADGGVGISNMFTGDAPTALMVMSRLASGRGGLGPGRAYLRLFASPFVFARALVLTVAEMLKELYQGRQQRLRGVEPRVPRHGSYVLLRGATNAVLRDLNVALVAEHMMAGAPVIFVDFVDYDEIAHHAGVLRPEALDALRGVDRVLGTLEQVAAAAPRAYEFVVLSDHGQSQGATFFQLAGHTLEEAVRRRIGADRAATMDETSTVEAWGPVNAMLTELLSATKTTARWSARRERPDGVRTQTPELVVAGSGNLGLVWFPRLPGRVPVEVIRREFPDLIPGLLAEPGVGFVVVDSGRGALAIGPEGVHVLGDGTVEGTDPLAPFGPRAARDLARVAAMTTAPDLYVHSSLDPRTGEVHAFEELVGCHGGLGGWQNEAALVHPAGWKIDADLLDGDLLYGADMVHRQLVRWLERCGARRADGP
ncbi:alkaline phosphatase family protein [Hamadaea tsunoensis]|uniref:alkaline phosphatase family protein n=1 Tax=Hamadaea tsunoensis TaxID=53368 RepID=UPI000400BDB3|nr:alkaline phosphatase family protein [Hamadaea tsunoensis]